MSDPLVSALKNGLATEDHQKETSAPVSARYIVLVGVAEQAPLQATETVRKVKKNFKKQGFFTSTEVVVFVPDRHKSGVEVLAVDI